MERVASSSTDSLLKRLRLSGFGMRELRKMFRDETGLYVSQDTIAIEEFKRWCEKFLSRVDI